MEKGTLKFFGNVRVGHDGVVTLPQLRNMYHAVVLAYGAASGKRLSVPGSSLQNVLSARDFVNWYNGHPSGSVFDERLVKDVKDVVICGLGNVALDCARILLKDPEAALHQTDISSRAVDALKKSKIKNVHILARRGPAQAACTPKELRELLGLEDVGVSIHPQSCLELSETCAAEIKGSRIHKRVVEVLKKHSGGEGNHHDSKRVHLHFLARPAEYVKGGDDRVGTTVVENMVLEKGETGQKAVGTGDMFSLDSQLVIESVGYQAEPIDGAPFDAKTGTIPNVLGRVVDDSNTNNLYVCGWLKRGPSGIIGTNLVDAEQTVDTMVRHLHDWGSTTVGEKKGRDGLLSILNNNFITFEDWKKIDAEEIAQGTSIGKVREKFTDPDTMIQFAHASSNK